MSEGTHGGDLMDGADVTVSYLRRKAIANPDNVEERIRHYLFGART